MKQIRCANCGRTQVVQEAPPTQKGQMTPFELRRQRWFYLKGIDVVLCGGSLSKAGVDDGRDWCQHMHHENHRDLYAKHRTLEIEIFMPGMLGSVPEGVEKHLEEVDGPEDDGSGD